MFVVDLFVNEHVSIRTNVFQGHAHESERVEPEADLLAHLAHPIGGIPVAPFGAAFQVAKRGKRHDAGIQPAVADLWDTRSFAVALLASDRDLIDPGSVEFRQRVHFGGVDRALFKLSHGADDRDVIAVLAMIERQRQAPEALA